MAIEEIVAPGSSVAGPPPVVGRFSDLVYQLRGNPATFAGLFIVALIFLSALLGPVLARYDPYGVNLGDAALAPSFTHPFGTDQYGHDVFTRVLIAARLDGLTTEERSRVQ